MIIKMYVYSSEILKIFCSCHYRFKVWKILQNDMITFKIFLKLKKKKINYNLILNLYKCIKKVEIKLKNLEQNL